MTRETSLSPVQWYHCYASVTIFPPSGSKTSKTSEYKVAGIGSKNFASGSIGVTGSHQLPFPLHSLDSVTCESWLWEAQ